MDTDNEIDKERKRKTRQSRDREGRIFITSPLNIPDKKRRKTNIKSEKRGKKVLYFAFSWICEPYAYDFFSVKVC